MAKKAPVRLHIDFESKWLGSAAFFGGLGFFLLCVYYFGFTNLLDCNILQILFHMLLPMAILAAVVILLHVMHYDAAQVVIALSGVYSLLMLIRSFSYSGVLGMVIGIVWYAIAAAVCLFMLTGFLTDKGYLSLVFLIPVIYRIVFVDIFQYVITLSLIDFVQEIAMLCGLTSLGLTALCFDAVTVKQRRTQE